MFVFYSDVEIMLSSELGPIADLKLTITHFLCVSIDSGRSITGHQFTAHLHWALVLSPLLVYHMHCGCGYLSYNCYMEPWAFSKALGMAHTGGNNLSKCITSLHHCTLMAKLVYFSGARDSSLNADTTPLTCCTNGFVIARTSP